MRILVTQIYASFWIRKSVCRWNKFRMSFKNRRFSSKKNSRHNYCKCLVFLQRMLIFISKIMDILVQIQKKSAENQSLDSFFEDNTVQTLKKSTNPHILILQFTAQE